MAEIPLANGGVALVDDEDVLLVSRYQWTKAKYHNRWYARATGPGGRTLFMHRLIMGEPPGLDVDHKNRNGLDNRRSTNLRAVPHSVNIANAGAFSHNTTGYRGVIRYRRGWRAQIVCQGRMLASGAKLSKRQAALLRDELARQLFQTTVYFNLPHVQPEETTVAEASDIIQRALERQA